MTIRVRLHAVDPSTAPSRPAATLVLVDDRSTPARFDLRSIDGDDRELVRRVGGELRQESILISRGSSSITDGIRTRSDSSGPEPYGTAAYWRAAVGRLESTMGLHPDPIDWSTMLLVMDQAGAEREPVLAADAVEAFARARSDASAAGPHYRQLQQDVRRFLEWQQGSPVHLAREVFARMPSDQSGGGALALGRPMLFTVARGLARSRSVASGARHDMTGAPPWLARTLDWILDPAETPRFVWFALVAAICLTGVPWSRLASRSAPSPDVVYGAVLSASGERGPRPADDFDRLQIPFGTTALQLTVPIAESSRDGRLVADIQALDDEAAEQPTATTIESSPTGVVARVLMPALPDGDYLLRLRHLAEVGGEVVVTRGFRVTRLAGSAPGAP